MADQAKPTVDTGLPPSIETKINEDDSPNVNPPEPPTPLTELFKRMHIQKKIITDPGPHATIDVIIDTRFTIYQLVDHCIKIFDEIKSRNLPAITPASLLAISLQQIYTYLAVIDTELIRETTSFYGQAFSIMPRNKQLLNLGTWMRTPPFIQDIIRGLVPTFDPRRKNLSYICSFAAFSFDNDFGRCLPTYMFLALHNIIAKHGANATFNTIWYEWLEYPVITIAEQQPIRVANIIGAAYDNNEVENFLTRKLKTLLSVTTLDLQQRKPVFKKFNFANVTYDEIDNDINPYEYLLGTHPNIITNMMSFINIMSNDFDQIFLKCDYLGAMFGIQSGTHVMNHFYGEPQLPTFHNLPVKFSEDKTKPKKPTLVNSATYADKLKFKCTFKCELPKAVTVKPMPVNVAHTKELYLVNTNPSVEPDIKASIYSSKRQRNQIILYSPYSTGESSMYYCLTNGIHIETFEIDSFHVPYPRLDNSINDENSHFLDSAIPISSAISRQELDGQSILAVRFRTIDNEYTERISHSYFNRAEHRIPMYGQRVSTETAENLLPGFLPVQGISHPNLASNKVAYSDTQEWTHKKCTDTFPTSPFIWSSYRWIDPMYAHQDTFLDSTYFICDLRTMYGTIPQTQMSSYLYDIVDK